MTAQKNTQLTSTPSDISRSPRLPGVVLWILAAWILINTSGLGPERQSGPVSHLQPAAPLLKDVSPNGYIPFQLTLVLALFAFGSAVLEMVGGQNGMV